MTIVTILNYQFVCCWQLCKAMNSSTLSCNAPLLPTLGGKGRDPLGILDIGLLNYTIVADNVPGPSIDHRELKLVVKPNPFFVQTTSHALKSQDCISLFVSCIIKNHFDKSYNLIPMTIHIALIHFGAFIVVFVNNDYRECTWIQYNHLSMKLLLT